MWICMHGTPTVAASAEFAPNAAATPLDTGHEDLALRLDAGRSSDFLNAFTVGRCGRRHFCPDAGHYRAVRLAGGRLLGHALPRHADARFDLNTERPHRLGGALMLKTAFAAALVFSVAFAAAQNDDTGLPASTPFAFPAQKREAPFWAKRVTGYIRTADGTRLRYSALLPRNSGRFPVVVSINGYDAGSIGGNAYLQRQSSMPLDFDKRLVEAGYAVMGVNAAGTGCSDGRLELIQPQLGRHGAEAVEFAAGQPWANGAVGMFGASYGGSSQLATAQQRPPHLRAIVPGSPLVDFRDALNPGGVPQPGFITPFRAVFRTYWSQVVVQTAKEEGDKGCVAQVGKNLAGEEARSVMQVFLSHPWRDAYADRGNLARNAGRIQVPVLALDAFQDQAITPRSGHYQQRLDASRLWRVQSNGRHDTYFAEAFQTLAVRFLDRFVKGQDNGFERDMPRTTLWMEAADRGQPRWKWMKVADPRAREFHIGPAGVLSDQARFGAADGFDYPGAGVAVNDIAGTSFWGELPANWKKTSLAYTSAPLDAPMMIYGPGSADLWVEASGGDADLQVTITELRPDGQETYVQRGWLRLSNRALDDARSTPLLPIHLDRADRLMPLLPGKPVLARVEINKMGHYFRQGSRLRLWIDTPAQTGGMVFDPFTQSQRIHVLHTRKYGSVLRLGVLDGVEGPASYPECGEVVLQPCRPDPFGKP